MEKLFVSGFYFSKTHKKIVYNRRMNGKENEVERRPDYPPNMSATQKHWTNASENAKKRVVKCRKSIINYWATRFSSLLWRFCYCRKVIGTICSTLEVGKEKIPPENFSRRACDVSRRLLMWSCQSPTDVRWKIFPRTLLSLPIKTNFKLSFFFGLCWHFKI